LKERSETLTNQAKENKEELAATKAKAIESYLQEYTAFSIPARSIFPERG